MVSYYYDDKYHDGLSKLLPGVRLSPVSPKELGLNLAAGIRKRFGFQRAQAKGGKELIIAVVQDRPSVYELEKQYLIVSGALDRPLILVFDQLGTRERERFVRRGIQFMIPGRFLFAPALGMFGTMPVFAGKPGQAVEKEELSAWAETLVIKRLLDDSIEMKCGAELANLFDTSTMTISRAVRELEDAGLCTATGTSGHTRRVSDGRQN